ncbi:MAG: tetratricopeptide repeat protein [bacterium]
MYRCSAHALTQWISVFLTGAATWMVLCFSASGSQPDFQIPEGIDHPVPLELSERSERTAEAHALYMQAIFDEETEGPDKAIENKKRVLEWDPGFCALAWDVAQHHLRRGETTEALSVLKDAAKASPRDPSAPIALATIYLRQLEKPTLAEKFALVAHDIAPDNSSAFEILCEVYQATGQSRKKELLFQKALKSENQDPSFWLDLADLRLRDIRRSKQRLTQSDSEKVLVLVDRAARCVDISPEMLARAGDVYLACGDASSAAELYKSALERQPSLAGLQEKLALCYSQSGDDSAAAELLERVVSESPMNLAAYDQLAGIRIRQKQLASALTNMRQALVIAPIDPRRYEDIIRIALRADDAKTALQYANEAEKRFPYLTGFTLLRAIALSQSRQHAASLMAFERTLVEASNSNPEMLDSAFYMSYATAAEQAGHYVKAAELVQTAIELDPENSDEPCNFLAYMWADRGENLDAAEQLVRRALARSPQNGAYVDTLGWIFFQQGKYPEALTELLRAASLLEKPDAVVLEHVGDAYEKLGKSSEAVKYWQKAQTLAPDNSSLAGKINRYSSKVAKQPDPHP